ncbi:hypothetical protein DVH24_008074 [Malus domestica]|uniref:Aquaporin n=1 Tax=Malus domestica TaxID=3750 RepID=A0A498JNZ8_MALDO|nr:hypothetical protein DVH24_008074 [Malus domestica]
MEGKEEDEPPPAPLFEPGELTSWSFYRAGIAEFIATFLFLYITILTVMGVNRALNVCLCGHPRKCLGLWWDHLCLCLLQCWYLRSAPPLFPSLQFSRFCIKSVCLQLHAIGGHINPAVTFGLFMARKLSLTKAVFYIVMQTVGVIAGAGVVKGF